jgi:colicin import membrane protein
VSENDLEMQLNIWKEMAISKQMLMLTATDALKLDENCSQEELRVALDDAIRRSIEADVDISRAEEQAKTAIAMMEKKLADSRKDVDVAKAAHAEALAAQQVIQQQISDERNSSAIEIKKLQETIAERDRALKAIKTALSDTPENIVKKLKTLKKQKLDEADARKEAEKVNLTLRKEKQALEKTIKEMQAEAEQKDDSAPAEE